MSLVFYDTETSGTQPSFDRILQFAAIKADPELDELERFEKRCRLSPHVIPSAGALRINRVPVARLIDSALPSHYEMVRAVRRELSTWTPPQCLCSNLIRFDEEMNRARLYKTLHNPISRTRKTRTIRAENGQGSLLGPIHDGFFLGQEILARSGLPQPW